MTFSNSVTGKPNPPLSWKHQNIFQLYYWKLYLWIKILLFRVFICNCRKLELNTTFVLLAEPMPISILVYC